MLITALVTLGIVMLAGSLLACCCGDRLALGLVLWLAGVAIAQTWLAYSWKSHALAWEAAYDRDIQRNTTAMRLVKKLGFVYAFTVPDDSRDDAGFQWFRKNTEASAA